MIDYWTGLKIRLILHDESISYLGWELAMREMEMTFRSKDLERKK